MPEIDITNVVQISVSTPPAGLANYAVNNLAYFTDATPLPEAAASLSAGYAVYKSPSAVAADWGHGSRPYQAAVAVFSQSPNILTGGGAFIIIPMLAGELLAAAILRANELVFFGGVLPGKDPWVDADPNAAPAVDYSHAEAIDAAKTMQSMDKLLFLASPEISAMDEGGLFMEIKEAGLTHARMLLHTGDHLQFAAAYAGRAMSTNFSGSATTATMHLKDLAGVSPDPLINETVLVRCQAGGVDVYVSIAGVPKVFTSGTNDFFDDIYNLIWFKQALTVAGFNALATTSTKIPQTEPGMSVLKGAYRLICEQALNNGFIAPGAWNSPELFGNPEDLRQNVVERGYYIYAQPVNQQPQTDREARKAPLVQMAVKFAGAIHSTNLIVYINR